MDAPYQCRTRSGSHTIWIWQYIDADKIHACLRKVPRSHARGTDYLRHLAFSCLVLILYMPRWVRAMSQPPGDDREKQNKNTQQDYKTSGLQSPALPCSCLMATQRIFSLFLGPSRLGDRPMQCCSRFFSVLPSPFNPLGARRHPSSSKPGRPSCSLVEGETRAHDNDLGSSCSEGRG